MIFLKKRLIFILCAYTCFTCKVYLCTTCVPGALGSQRWYWMPWNWDYRWFQVILWMLFCKNNQCFYKTTNKLHKPWAVNRSQRFTFWIGSSKSRDKQEGGTVLISFPTYLRRGLTKIWYKDKVGWNTLSSLKELLRSPVIITLGQNSEASSSQNGAWASQDTHWV